MRAHVSLQSKVVVLISRFLYLGLALVVSVACTKRPTTTNSATISQFAQLESAAETSPTFNNLIALGLAYDGAGRTNDAIVTYKKAVAAEPNNPVAWNNLCAAFNVLGRHLEAVEHCEKAIALAPDFTRAAGNLQVAKAGLETQKKEVLERNKNWKLRSDLRAEEYIGIGLDYYSVRALDNAIEVWGKVNKNDPLYATALSNMTSAYIVMGKFSAAEKSISEALKIDPNNQLFQNNKAWLESAKAQKK